MPTLEGDPGRRCGYTRLMGGDAHPPYRKDFIEPKVAAIVKLTGDGALVEFAIIDAVQCAVVIQRGIAEKSAAEAPSQRIEFRIGINLGDVIFDEDDIYGDGVNIAARLEGLAAPGGICISDTAHQMARAWIWTLKIWENNGSRTSEPVRVWH